VLGSTGDYGSGWFNTSVTRSVGWHHGQIIFRNNKGDGRRTVEFRIDGALAFSTARCRTSVVQFHRDEFQLRVTPDGYSPMMFAWVWFRSQATTVLLLCGAAMLFAAAPGQPLVTP